MKLLALSCIFAKSKVVMTGDTFDVDYVDDDMVAGEEARLLSIGAAVKAEPKAVKAEPKAVKAEPKAVKAEPKAVKVAKKG